MTIKKTLKTLGFGILGCVGLAALYLGAAYGLSHISIDEEANEKDELSIYIQTNGVHTDLVLPVQNKQKDWRQDVKFEYTKAQDSTCQYLAMGWGDKGFYLETPTWADLKTSVALKAATGLSTTAIHATFIKTMVENKDCVKINISHAQYARLVTYIENSFQKDAQGQTMRIATNANYGANDAFYEANGSYSLFGTCNTWANNALKASGQKACLWTPFDTGIFEKYQ
jgi:uncharacterized protein (TIGR02117 family)